MADQRRGTRRRQGRGERRSVDSIEQKPWRVPKVALKPVEILSADQVEEIHRASLELLRDYGIEIMSERALDLFEQAGAKIDRSNGRVRMDPDMVEATIRTAPSQFSLEALNRSRDLPLGDGHISFCAVSSTPNCSDLDNGRRPGNFADFEKLVRLAQSLNAIHCIGGYPVEPTDIPPSTRHLDCLRTYVNTTDKALRTSALGRVRVEDAQAIAALAHGLKPDELDAHTLLFTVININSPLRLDGPMADGLMAMSERNQCVIVTPFTLLGAMAPVTIEGALVQQNAEALTGIALTQLTRPGSPVVYGCFCSNVDMKSGAPAFGTPEYVRATLASGQLARRYDLPLRVTNANASNAVDAQAAYESQMSLWAAVLAGASFVHHAAGWLEGGLVASYEKMVLDAEMLQMMAEVVAPFDFENLGAAVEAIKGVGPGGHFFGSPHTMERYETAFYAPLVSDWRNFETWEEAGAPDAATRANKIWKELLERFEPPVLAPDRVEAIDAFVAQRKEALKGVSLD